MPRPQRTILLLLALLLGGCASVSGPPDERDPWESFNRGAYAFNDDFDRAILRPLAEGYEEVVPQPVNDGISNFFSNLDDVVVLFNDLLQLKFRQAAEDFSRLTWNTTVGLFGLIDVATPMGLRKHNEDFGQTLGYWGVGTGPYLVIPFLGPSTLRDGAGTVVDWKTNPLDRAEDDTTYYGAVVVRAVDTRAGLLRASRVMEQAALDPYIFLRDAYLQRRENLVYDGNPPAPEFDLDDPFMDEDALFGEPAPAGDETPPAEENP